jgi:hypothetical protein
MSFGSDDFHQLSNTDNFRAQDDRESECPPSLVELLEDFEVVQVAAGGLHCNSITGGNGDCLGP